MVPGLYKIATCTGESSRFAFVLFACVCVGLYMHLNRGPMTKEGSRVHGCQKVHGWKACTKPMEVVSQTNKRRTRLKVFTDLVVCVGPCAQAGTALLGIFQLLAWSGQSGLSGVISVPP